MINGGASYGYVHESPSGSGTRSYGPRGQPVDNALWSKGIMERVRTRVVHRLPTLSRLSPTYPQDHTTSVLDFRRSIPLRALRQWCVPAPELAGGNGIPVRTILNRTERHPSFVFAAMLLVEGLRLRLEVESATATSLGDRAGIRVLL